MGLKFLNSELQMLCARKLTNASVINSVTDICIFQVNITLFKDFSIPMIIFKTFQGLENFYIKFQDFPYFSRICTNPEISDKLSKMST